MLNSSMFLLVDAWLIAPFRWLQSSQASFVLGTMLLAIQCVVVGQVCLWGVNRLQHQRRAKYDGDARRHTELSMQALMCKDKDAYLAQNTMAKEAYNHSMSLGVGRMTASLWPAVFALAWMDLRFHDVLLELPCSLPLIGPTVYYPFYFILLYIAVRVLFAWIKRVISRHFVENKCQVVHTSSS